VSVGRLAPIKYVHEMITAMALLRQSGLNVQLILVGGELTAKDREYGASLKGLCRELGLDGVVHFQGPVAFSEIADSYHRGGFFLNLSQSGSLDKAILESMAAGCIPISCNDAFRHLATGHGLVELIPGPGPEGAAACISSLVQASPRCKRRLRQRLRDIVVAEHSLDSLADHIVAHMQAIQHADPSDVATDGS